MKRTNFIGLIYELSLSLAALACIIISAIYVDVPLICASIFTFVVLLLMAGWFLAGYLGNTGSYPRWLWRYIYRFFYPYTDIDGRNTRKDRLRYTKNKLSSTLAMLGIAFDALYFISIYSSDVGDYFYNYTIGLSIVYNLLFLLCVFLSSEGVKNYKMGYAIALLAVGAMQIVRIFYIPVKAHATLVEVGTETICAMPDGQFTYVVTCLLASALACIAAGVIGIIKSTVLTNYKKQIGEA